MAANWAVRVRRCQRQSSAGFARVVVAVVATAAGLTWQTLTLAADFYWNNAAGGLFTESTHWSLSDGTPANGPGGASDTVLFDLGLEPASRYTVDGVSGANRALLVHSDSVLFNVTNYALLAPFAADSLVIGVASGDIADVILRGNGSSTLTTGDASIGQNSSTGSLTVDNLRWTSSSSMLDVGENGTLEIINGSYISTSWQNVDGTVIVDSLNSEWDGSFLDVSGTGSLTVNNGGAVSTTFGWIGRTTESTASVTIEGSSDGVSSTLTASSLDVGFTGSGTLSITSGAQANTGRATIGISFGSVGTVTVDGTGSSWNSSELIVGEFGSGTVRVSNDGLVDVTGSTLVGGGSGTGRIDFDDGTLITKVLMLSSFDQLNQLTGTGTIHTNGLVMNGDLSFDQSHPLQRQFILNSQPDQNVTVNLNVDGTGDLGAGYSGQGTLSISEGVTVTSASAYLGYLPGSNGVASVIGAGSSWINNGSLFVGNGGAGTLIISEGGNVSSLFTSIAFNSGSTGMVTVDGVGSEWICSTLYVGYRGTGMLSVTNDGLVSASSLHVDFGTLTIMNGGRVSSISAGVGTRFGSSGSVIVNGAGSTWTSDSLEIGGAGIGAISVSNGGLIDVNGSTFLADGQVSIDIDDGMLMAKTLLLSSFDQLDQLTGAGTIHTRGLVTNGDLRFDQSHPLERQFFLNSHSGQNITIDLDVDGTGDLGVGYNGQGTLSISEGVTVTSASGYLGYSPSSTGTATVTGAGSSWNNNSFLYVGNRGIGTLNISEGGDVTSDIAYIGFNSGSNGTVTVDGAGSTFVASTMNVRSGALNISRGALATTGSSAIAGFASKIGAVTVTGSGSRWNTSLVSVGGSSGSVGTLSISDGGVVSSSGASVGAAFAGGSGTVTIEGAGSRWLLDSPTSDLEIGRTFGSGGSGAVTIRSGARLQVGRNTTIGMGGRLSLEGGTFSSSAISFQGDGQFQWTSGTLHVGTFHGDLVDWSGTLAPGNSPGITTIMGDYEQDAGDVLEIEVGGLTPGTHHDQLRVTGTAMLGGRLEVPIINVPGEPPFTPQPGDPPLTFLTAGSNPDVGGELSGTFDSVLFRDLPAGVAHELDYDYDADEVRLRFVPPEPIRLVSTAESAPWAIDQSWEVVQNGMPTVPLSKSVVSVANETEENVRQQVLVSTPNESVHGLAVGDANAEIAVRIEGSNLSVATGTAIETNGAIELGNELGNTGTLTSQTVSVRGGGALKGNGSVVGNLSVGTSGGEPAIFRPGFSVGHVGVLGNYEQGASGVFELDVEGTDANEFDTLQVSGEVQLGGTLRINTTELTNFTPGQPMEIIAAGSVIGQFAQVETISDDGVRVWIEYSELGVSAEIGGFGDMNGDKVAFEDVDFNLFVFALMNRNSTKFSQKVRSTCDWEGGRDCAWETILPKHGGSYHGQDFVDFDDIPFFASGDSGSASALMAAFDRYFNVPEPSSMVLILVGELAACVAFRRPRRGATYRD